MPSSYREQLRDLARTHTINSDIAHDFLHVDRVLANAEHIHSFEGGDIDVITAAALLHDVVVYAKNDRQSKTESTESAEKARQLLPSISFPQGKIDAVCDAVREHSDQESERTTLESKVVYDADKLEKTGAMSIMRIFSSSQQLERAFYHETDPFCENRDPEQFGYTLDVFYSHLLHIPDKLYTSTAQEMARERTAFLRRFLQQCRKELNQQ